MPQIPLFSGFLLFCKRKLLGAPARLPIARMEDLQTNYIGKAADGRLFLGYETMFNSSPNKGLTGKEWDLQRGFTFGLIPNLKNRFINLEPGALISFAAPWDGEYYT